MRTVFEQVTGLGFSWFQRAVRPPLVAVALFVLAGGAGWSTAHAHSDPNAQHAVEVPAGGPADTTGKSTLEQRIRGVRQDPDTGFSFLRLGPGEPFVLRQDLARAAAGRERRRRSLIYLAQLTDFQLADEESPARVEQAIDPIVTPTLPPSEDGLTGSAAWRPQEAFVAHQVEYTIRQVNRFLTSPVAQGDGSHARMLNAVMTGDLADNQQRNETEGVVRLLEGGVLHPNSGSSTLADYSPLCQGLAATGRIDPNEAPNYTGVQDYDDYIESLHFYDPERPLGVYRERGYPTYPGGLLDRAQEPFRAQGLKVPSYVLFGNHDAQVQGNEDANAAYEELATGCLKPIGPSPPGNRLEDILDPDYLRGALSTAPEDVLPVPPDEERQFVDRAQFRKIHDTGAQDDAHGFAYVDKEELDASDGFASYYSFAPKRGLRYIVLDTNSQGGFFVAAPSQTESPYTTTDRGNIDDPQFRWLRRQLTKASSRNELVMVFGHHGTGRLLFDTPDEGGGVPPCKVGGQEIRDEHGHNVHPGCDRDPRSSSPLHFGDDLIALLHRHRNVIAYVAGHSHEARVTPFKRRGGGGFWEIKTPAIVDWPPQHRLIEVMDNRDGTLSIFGTLLDHDGPATAPASGGNAGAFNTAQLASVGRTLSYNDPQSGPKPRGTVPLGPEGQPLDRNVELLVGDPRRRARTSRADAGEPESRGKKSPAAGGDSGGESSGEKDDGELPFTGLGIAAMILVAALLATAGILVRQIADRRSA